MMYNLFKKHKPCPGSWVTGRLNLRSDKLGAIGLTLQMEFFTSECEFSNRFFLNIHFLADLYKMNCMPIPFLI